MIRLYIQIKTKIKTDLKILNSNKYKMQQSIKHHLFTKIKTDLKILNSNKYKMQQSIKHHLFTVDVLNI